MGALRPSKLQQPTASEEGACCTPKPGLREGRPQGVGAGVGAGDRNLPSPASLPPCLLTLAQLPASVHCGYEGVRDGLPDEGAGGELPHVGTGGPCMSAQCLPQAPRAQRFSPRAREWLPKPRAAFGPSP